MAATAPRCSVRAVRPWLAVAVCAAAVGCSKGGARKISRDRDAAPVVVIERTPGGVNLADEAEPNDSPAEAGPLALPGGVRGSLNGDTDVDLYRLDVTAPGFLEARLSGIEGVDLILELRDAEGKELVRSDRGPALVVEGFPNYPVVKGSYLLSVSEFVKKSARRKKKSKGKRKGKDEEPELVRAGPSPVYELTAEVKSGVPEGGEIEPDDDLEQAGEVILGSDRFGYIGWNHDQDAWKVPLEEFPDGYGVDLEVTGVPIASLTVELLDPEGKVVVSRKGAANQNVNLHNLVPVPGADRFDLQISARRSNPIDPYSLRAVSRLLDLDEEIEPNDDPTTAMALREDSKESGGTRRGFLGAGDVDCFRLEPVGTSFLLTVSIEPGPSGDVQLSATTDKGVALGESDRGKDGVKEELVGMPIPAGTGVVVQVKGRGRVDQPYRLDWSVVPDTGTASPILDEYP